jgi:hypothetical protein
MKTLIVKNTAKKTITVIIAPISIGYTDYLYERYNDERYFASGVLMGADYTKDIVPLAQQIVSALNEVCAETLPQGEKFTIGDIIQSQEGVWRLISKNTIEGKEWDKTYKLNLSSKSKDANKRFLFEDLAQTKPISKDDGWKHLYAVEIEISGGYDEDNLAKYTFSIFHRGVSVGKKESTFSQNDNAWSGFDFTADDDLPF